MAITNASGAVVSITSNEANSGVQGSGIQGYASTWANLYNPGSYTLTLSTNVGSDEFTMSGYTLLASVQFNFYSSHGVQNINKMLGGLRINNIQEYDGINPNPINSKYYVYDSAFVINPVDTVNNYVTSQSKVLPVDGAGDQYIYELVTRNSSTKYSLGSIQGGMVKSSPTTASMVPMGIQSPALPAIRRHRRPYRLPSPFPTRPVTSGNGATGF
jgi:hypothetical protein